MSVRRFGAAVGAAGAVLGVLRCGGGTAPAGADASSDASTDAGAQDLDAWWRRFDARPFDDAELPLPGEVPPGYPGPCWNRTICGTGECDDSTGWCCRGIDLGGLCRCGQTLGCTNQEICCTTYVGALEPKVSHSSSVRRSRISTTDAAPSSSFAWRITPRRLRRRDRPGPGGERRGRLAGCLCGALGWLAHGPRRAPGRWPRIWDCRAATSTSAGTRRPASGPAAGGRRDRGATAATAFSASMEHAAAARPATAICFMSAAPSFNVPTGAPGSPRSASLHRPRCTWTLAPCAHE